MAENTAPITVIVRSMDRTSLARALDSISTQVLKPAEIVVVAACGLAHRALPRVHSDINARLVFPPAGMSRLLRPEAANTGLHAATQQWIGFLDDDDELMPSHFSTLLPVATNAFAKFGNNGRLAYSLAQGVDANGAKTDVYGRSFSWIKFWESTILHTMNGLFHRSLISDGCLFDGGLDIHEDWDFWLQCAQRTSFAYVETVTSIWHGAEGESGCGFGANLDRDKYLGAKESLLKKWGDVRERVLAEISQQSKDAVAARQRGDEVSAIKLCQSVLRIDPENVNAANLLGMISLNRGDLTSAHQLMTVAINNAPPHFGLCLNMGIIEDALGRNTEARQWYRKGLQLNPFHEGLRKLVEN